MIIEGIRLLTLEQYKKYKSNISSIGHNWWLRNSAISNYAYMVTHKGTIETEEKQKYLGIRPVLIIKNLTIIPNDKIDLFGFSWTVLDCDWNSATILCDSSIGTFYFNRSSENWTDSDIGAYLENWLYYSIEASEVIVTYESKTEFLLLQSLCKKYNLNELCSDLCINIGCLVYSPYKDWRLTAANTHKKPLLSFEDFCEYITKENSV